jgi:F-type H+-transporting ATPase subunit gamma
MEMIATARFKKAHIRAVGAKPYTEKISQLVAALGGGEDCVEHPLLRKNEDVNRTVLLVLTSNRGLCGGYNSNVIRMASHQIKLLGDAEREIDLRVSGKKGMGSLRFMGHKINIGYTEFDEKTTYETVESLADEYIDLYSRGEIDAVRVVYTKFVSSARHYAEVMHLLPLGGLGEEQEEEKASSQVEEYIFSPGAEEILNELIPTMVRTELFQCFIDAIVSEQVARMNAMRAATDNAEQMIRALARQYNRVRQNNITSDLLDVVGGAEALK